ncbi:MAG: DNA mismatch repair protein MutS [Treponematales bacterium]
MFEQYNRIKREHQGQILFFRLGDFYEMFADDAVEISSLLNLTLTTRNGLPMCGIPYHAVRGYIARILKAGKKIAVCEQLSLPGKGLIERRVVEVITPGTTIDEDFLEKGAANYLAALASAPRFLSFAYIDLSTGEFSATSFPVEESEGALRGELERLPIREMIVQESLLGEWPDAARAIEGRQGLVVNRWADWLFDPARSLGRLERQFGPEKLKAFGIKEHSPEIIASGALLDYLDDTSQSLLPHVSALRLYTDSEFVGIDEASLRNLELVRNLQDGGERYTLLEVMNETRTAMGRRLLRQRILHPLRDEGRINARLDMVESLYHNQEALAAVREILGRTPDLERLASRLAMDRAHGKDMAAIRNALAAFGNLEEKTSAVSAAASPWAFENPDAASFGSEDAARLAALRGLLERGIAGDPSTLLTEGNLIKDGYSAELDRLRGLKENGRKTLEDYLEEERQRTGIPSLKIRYNRLLGYFFEVTKAHLAKVPARFIRRQGIVNGERFTTERLSELEAEINGASEKAVELERQLFLEIREKAKEALGSLTAAGRRMAETDAAQSLARAATIHGWVRPEVDGGNGLRVIEGRHPVVEAHLQSGGFVPNDIILQGASPDGGADGDGVSFALITGPNMAGKSTYLRQAALLVIMAQAGSFVPAREACVGMADRIYCRVGASDNLARGESTFLVEMSETAYILRTATRESLVIMDEVGRGTGAADGLSIAQAVCEDLLERKKCRALFATHYHELSGLSHPRMANRSMEVQSGGGNIVFLRKLKEGPSAESYGLHVARLAGLPEEVVARAEEIMAALLTGSGKGGGGESAAPRPAPPVPKAAVPPFPANALAALDLDTLSPKDALALLYQWKTRLTRVTAAPGPVAAPAPKRSPASDTASPRPAPSEPGLFD